MMPRLRWGRVFDVDPRVQSVDDLPPEVVAYFKDRLVRQVRANGLYPILSTLDAYVQPLDPTVFSNTRRFFVEVRSEEF